MLVDPEDSARNLLGFAGLTAAERATVLWNPEKRAWILAQAADLLAALDDPDWPQLNR
jgi:hypothetical protein